VVVLGLTVGTAGFGYLWGVRYVRVKVLRGLNALGEQLGRPVTLAQLEVAPTELVVGRLVLSTPDGARLDVREARVTIDPFAALRGDRRPRAISLSGVTLQLPVPLPRRGPLADVLERLQGRGDPDGDAPAATGDAPRRPFPPVTVRNADILFRDARGELVARLAVSQATLAPPAPEGGTDGDGGDGDGGDRGDGGLRVSAHGVLTDGPPSLPRTAWDLVATLDRGRAWRAAIAFAEPVPLPAAFLPPAARRLRIAAGGVAADSDGAARIEGVAVSGALPGTGPFSLRAGELTLGLDGVAGALPHRWPALVRGGALERVVLRDVDVDLPAHGVTARVPEVTVSFAGGGAGGAAIGGGFPWPARVDATRPTITLARTPPDLPGRVRAALLRRLGDAPAAPPLPTPPAPAPPTAAGAPADAAPERARAVVAAALSRLGDTGLGVAGGTLRVEGGGRALVLTGLDVALDPSVDGLFRELTVRARTSLDGGPPVHVALTAHLTADGHVRPRAARVEGPWLAPIVRGLRPWLRVAADAGGRVDVEFLHDLDDPVLLLAGRFELGGLGLEHDKVARIPIDGLGAAARYELRWDRAGDRVDLLLSEATPGHTRANIVVQAEHASQTPRLTLNLDVPRQACDRLLRDIPPALVPRLQGAQLQGTIAFHLDARFDAGDPDAFRFDLSGDWSQCGAVTLGPHVDVGRLLGNFEHRIWENGSPTAVAVGPGTPDYVLLDLIPVHVQQAALATEDMAFFEHEGFRPTLMSRAVRLNLRKGRYVYGGSTISQQLVKNLFLSREKTLSRKLEEAIITWHMERTVTKERILELYLNCIEFGPGIYGIKKAAATYFGVHPSALTPLEGAFIMGLKPDPKTGYNVYKRRRFRLKWRDKLDHILKRLWRDMGVITEQQYRKAAPYIPIFHYPGEGYVRPQPEGFELDEPEPDTPGAAPRSDDEHAPALGGDP
jgi:hypothetical protein